jgi:CHRD domain
MRIRIVLALSTVAGLMAVLAGIAVAGSATSVDSTNATARSDAALFAVMTGRKEVGTDGRRGAGDPDGRGSFSATIDGAQLCFGITVTNIAAPNAAHVHRGRPNQNGGIVVPLTPPSGGDPGASSGCVSVAADLAAAILKNPGKYYANVHNSEFPGGAVRGQLFGLSR